VLEHVSSIEISTSLAERGCVFLHINLPDHRGNSFDLLRRDNGYDLATETDARSARIRPGEWQIFFKALADWDTMTACRTIQSDMRPRFEDWLPEFAAMAKNARFMDRK
jgi:hypothetical protein